MDDKIGVIINNQTHFLPVGMTAGEILKYLELPDGYNDGIYYFVNKRMKEKSCPVIKIKGKKHSPLAAKLYIHGKTGRDLQDIIFPVINLSYVPDYDWFHVHKNEVAIEENGDELFISICKRRLENEKCFF